MDLLVETPATRLEERRYVLGVVLGEWLGLSWQLRPSNRRDVRIAKADGGDGAVVLPDHFFRRADEDWLGLGSLPSSGPRTWDSGGLRGGPCLRLVDRRIPIVVDGDGHAAEVDGAELTLPLDVLGTAFFMLSRYEEWVLPDRDGHERFPARASQAARCGFLRRPVVDEQVEVLRWALRRILPSMPETRGSAVTKASCDVDRPFDPDAGSPVWLARRLLGDVLRRGRPKEGLARFSQFRAARRGDRSLDPLNTFDWMMDIAERAGHQITFNFMAVEMPGPWDVRYRIGDPWIRSLLRSIHRRGHSIGLHGSYDSGVDASRLRSERERLQQVLIEEEIGQRVDHGRLHYLRWCPRRSAGVLEEAGIRMDSTLGFADQPGFRSGTCRDHPMFDLGAGAALQLRQQPLVCMECSVLSSLYLSLDPRLEGLEAMRELRTACRTVGGDFTLLWHNSQLLTREERGLFERMLEHRDDRATTTASSDPTARIAEP